jgi:REP element-mobilizing transposase RayT
MRGINRQDIFYDDEDFQRFLETLGQMKLEQQFEIYGYCLMSNHIHLLIREKKDHISRIMSRIGTSYAWWYNRKYNRSGHVFQGRYGSECVEDDKYLLTVIRYIHNNPVKAGMVSDPEHYKWSSIHAYYGGREYLPRLTEPEFILGIIHQESSEAIQGFRSFMKRDNDDKCLDDEIKFRKTDGELRAEIKIIMYGDQPDRLKDLDKKKRNEILRKIKEIDGVSLRQIARVTGLSLSFVFKA